MDFTPINPERIRKLMDFGLTEYQCRVYLTLLDFGTATASQIPPISRVPRTRIYATMSQLHEKGLVEIVPETPVRYKPVPFSNYLRKMSEDYKQKAIKIEKDLDLLSSEFAVHVETEPQERGRFEAIYGRRNARERLLKMYDTAAKEIVGIGTSRSPGRILKAFGSLIEEKAKAGVVLRYAFPFSDQNSSDVKILAKYAQVRNIGFEMPVYMHVVDGREFFMSHPIPDDDSFYIGDDICIWTDDVAIAKAIKEMAQQIWKSGQDVRGAG